MKETSKTPSRRTVALRFGDNLTSNGTISEHQSLIDSCGSVWYGKFGSNISQGAIESILDMDFPAIMLIRSGSIERYWAFVSEISNEIPSRNTVPEYYWHLREKVGCWFHITSIVLAPKNIMSQCTVASSGRILSESAKGSLSPFFIIDVPNELLPINH